MKRTLFGVLCLVLASIGVSSCEEQGTEVVFEFWSDLPDVTNVDLEIIGVGADDDPRAGDGCVHRVTLNAAEIADGAELSFTYAVRPGNSCNERVFVRATLRNGTEVKAVSGAGQDFVEGESKRARIYVPNRLGCEPGQLWCDTVCSDGATDADHCGWCRNDCPVNGVCRSGWCECPEGWELCGDACLNLQKDPDNCGSCGAACGPEEACVNGHCSGDCSPLTRCGRSCVDTATDRVNCGSCGRVCETGVCSAGECDSTCAAPLLSGDCNPIDQCGCPAGQRCDGVHNPYDWEGPEFCTPAGDAGPMAFCDESTPATTCGPGLTCIWNDTGIRGPELPPDGPGGTCRKWCLLGDGATCDAEEGTCVALSAQYTYGVCYPYPEMESCNGVDDDFDGMVDYLGSNFDPFNCGWCGTYCDSGSCMGGMCQDRCEDSFRTTCPDGLCYDTLWDRLSCGNCPPDGTTCARNETCHLGACMPGTVGDPCEDPLQCSDVALVTGFCAMELMGMPIPHGYCTRICDPGLPMADRCPSNSKCVTPTGGGISFCLRTCDPRSPEVCRQSQGYDCVSPTGVDYYCLPTGGAVEVG